ncbi:hypothetical protein COCSUDRAFT_54974 [Coccomyxa subellipsoidea C-169]|uniref:Uncharacterized protein n=1 Tax=Coccomyxa subellipsoidea (strain C-169) TaxID=574566 RepID=I0YII1_COCSC|nr:hypothetical protein COCSUDRAFT_54974 [Coccomyxa subellipsoidea C-169]EIE18200.1 hypothetical protein COCSUDRAFT_54974 [Coccomyxa subellipsoidea C-169]|eukprot:XP_005642744.1 hypothetical protein COCSUDRAFT_54974 [Coccomyxa subellipsoidea C-169]
MGTTQQSISTLQQQQQPTADLVPQIKRQDKVYKTGGLPVWAAVFIPCTVVALVALLLFVAQRQRKHTERLTRSLLTDPAANTSLKARTDTEDSEA